jgi:serine protease inhibitor
MTNFVGTLWVHSQGLHMTKKLKITLELSLNVPDDWELHKTSGATDVIKLPNGQFVDFTYAPMVATDPEDEWTTADTDELIDELIDMTEDEDVTYTVVHH